VLNKVLAHEARVRGKSALVRSYNFGPWDGGMVGESLKAHFSEQGVGLIDAELGARFFAEDLERARPVEVVVSGSGLALPPESELYFTIDPRLAPELLDHRIRGRVVVPVVVVLERVLRIAEALRPRPDLAIRVEDLRVLAGVTLAPDEVCRLSVRIAPHGTRRSALEITFRDDAGRGRYRSVVDFTLESAAPLRAPTNLVDWPLTAEMAYAGPLFHGPRFQAIDRLEGVSRDGGRARLMTADRLGWPALTRSLDPALLDGGLQLGLLWAAHEQNMLALPQRLGAVRVQRQPERGEPVHCAFSARPNGTTHIDFDFVFATLDGDVLAEIRDAEFYAYER
jgi:hypothetical protein